MHTFHSPLSMYNHLLHLTSHSPIIRNFVGTISSLSSSSIVIPSPLFPLPVLQFYTKHNMGLLDPIKDKDLYEKYYNEARGGGQGDYSFGFREKMENVVDCLKRYPNSKRAVITLPYSNKTSPQVLHSDTAEQKCLRELTFFIEEGRLHCTGFMRAQAVTIFPKNIHFVGSVMQELSNRIGVEGGSYTHFVVTLVRDRE